VSRILGSPSAVADIDGAPNAPSLPHEGWLTLLDSMVWLRDGQVVRFAVHGPLITDDHPLTEYYFLHQLFPGAADPTVTESLLRRLTS
jgi:hypothetical protein